MFQFYHEVDVDRVLHMSPVTFNNHMLLLDRLRVSRSIRDAPFSL